MSDTTSSSAVGKFARLLSFAGRNAANESAILHSAERLGLFREILASPEGRTAEELARSAGASARGVRCLLEPVAGMGLLTLDEKGRFAAPANVAKALGSAAVRGAFEDGLRWFAPSQRLKEAVQTGAPISFDGKSYDLLGHYHDVFLADPAPLPEVEADLVARIARNYLATQALVTAAELGLLSKLDPPGIDPRAFAAEKALSEEGVRVLVGALSKLGLVTAAPPHVLSEVARTALPGTSLAYVAGELPVTNEYWGPLADLDRAVREEKFLLDLKVPEVSARFYAQNSQQITAVFASHYQLARRAALTVDGGFGLAGKRVLDIGTGSGVWGTAFAKVHPSVSVTFFDQPAVLPNVKLNVEKLKFESQASYQPGNLFKDSFGEAAFDVVILPCVLDVVLPKDLEDVVRRATRALKPDGVLVICEYILNDRRDGPLDYLYFQFRRYITNEGDLLSYPEFQALLRAVGFHHSKLYPLPTQELILATREPRPLPEALAALPQKQKAAASA